MKKVLLLSVIITMLLSSCGTMTGFFAGGALGGAVGGIMGGPYGRDIGTLVGMAAGSAIGAAADAAEAKAVAVAERNRTRHFDEVYAQHKQSYTDYYYQKNKTTDAPDDKIFDTKDMVDHTNSGNDIIEMK